MPSDDTRILIGTIGQSVWRSDDGGETFTRQSAGLFLEADIRALEVDPATPGRAWVGTESGLARSDDLGDTWERLRGPMDGRQVWSIALHPRDPETVIVGTCPAGLCQTEDGGRTWRELDALMPAECHGGAPLIPRVTVVRFGPDPTTIYAGIEIDGGRRSRDGGRTWEAFHAGLSSRDIHGLAIYPDAPDTLIATTNRGVNRSTDGGETWTHLDSTAAWPWQYTRWCSVDPNDAAAVFVGAGNGPPGSEGGLYRTADQGRSWTKLALPCDPANSTIWNMASHPADPRRLYATSVSGQLFATTDGGATWGQLPREFGEVRAVSWSPA